MSFQPNSARKSKVSRAAVVVGALALFAASCSSSNTTRVLNAVLGATVSHTFETGEDRTFVVPDGVTSIDVSVSGAQGGARSRDEAVSPGTGGKGGRVAGQITVTPGETLTVQVGEKGADQNVFGGAYPDGGAGGIQVRFLIRPTTTIGYTYGGSTALEAEGHRESREETHF